MPAGFHFPDDTVEIWKPMVFDAESLSEDNRGSRSYAVVARLKPGVSVEQAQAGMNLVSDGMVRQHPHAYRGGYYTTVRGLQEEIVGGTRRVLLLQFGAVGFVLLIACANVANLLLARGSARRKEVAIRRALGAKRSRIVGQLLTESVLLGVCGGAVGLIVAVWGLDLLVALAPSDIPRLAEIALDARVVAFTAIVSLLTGILFGLVPALQMSRTDPGDTLKEGGRSGSAGRRRALGHALIVAEVALSLVLLVGAGLLVNSFARVHAAAPGFNPERVLTMRIAPPDAKYSFERGEALYADLFARLRATPGVHSVGAINALPLSGFGGDRSFYIEGRSTTRPEDLPDEEMRFVTPGYFGTMQIPILQGREFNERDTLASPRVAVINQALARKYFPTGDAIGTRVGLHPAAARLVSDYRRRRRDQASSARCQGVAGTLRAERAAAVFRIATVRALFVAVRTDGDPLAMTAAVRQVRGGRRSGPADIRRAIDGATRQRIAGSAPLQHGAAGRVRGGAPRAVRDWHLRRRRLRRDRAYTRDWHPARAGCERARRGRDGGRPGPRAGCRRRNDWRRRRGGAHAADVEPALRCDRDRSAHLRRRGAAAARGRRRRCLAARAAGDQRRPADCVAGRIATVVSLQSSGVSRSPQFPVAVVTRQPP
jgi:predicted permease